MTRTDLSFLTIRVFALYSWFQALLLVSNGYMGGFWAIELPAPDATAFRAGLLRTLFFMPSIVLVVLGFVLFFASRPLARFILPPVPPSSEPVAGAITIAQALFSAVGVATLLQAGPGLLDFPILSWRFQHNLPGTLGICGQIILATLLFLRPSWFTRLLTRSNAKSIVPSSESK